MAQAPGPGTAVAARTTWRSCSPSSRGSSATPFTKTAVAYTPMTAWPFAFSTRPEQGPVATSSTTSRYTPSVFVRTGKRTGSGPLTSTPSTVKASGRKTQANPQKTFPRTRLGGDGEVPGGFGEGVQDDADGGFAVAAAADGEDLAGDRVGGGEQADAFW